MLPYLNLLRLCLCHLLPAYPRERCTLRIIVDINFACDLRNFIFTLQLTTSLSSNQRLVADSSSDLARLGSDLENGRAELKSLDQALGAQRTALAVANRAAEKRREETKALAKEAEEVIQGRSTVHCVEIKLNFGYFGN